MKKMLVFLFTATTLFGLASSVSAHEWRGGYGGHWYGPSNWAPVGIGVIAGAAVAHVYYRPAPAHYVPQYYYYPPQQQTVAYCPENGLYYPQTQACPSGWQRVIY
jgi:hypothetical protein